MNVKHRRCAESGCNTRPAFNWNGEEKGAYCNKHKEKGMINVDKKEPRVGGPLSSLPHAALLSKCLGSPHVLPPCRKYMIMHLCLWPLSEHPANTMFRSAVECNAIAASGADGPGYWMTYTDCPCSQVRLFRKACQRGDGCQGEAAGQKPRSSALRSLDDLQMEKLEAVCPFCESAPRRQRRRRPTMCSSRPSRRGTILPVWLSR